MRRQRRRPGPEDEVNRGRGPAAGPRILVLGVGNPGREDDGLGPAAVEGIEALHLAGVVCDANYQLNVEDALACREHDIVVFIDAAEDLGRPYVLKELRPDSRLPAMTHAMGPEAVLALCAELYGRRPQAWLLAVGGCRFETREGLSPEAASNLEAAVAFLAEFLAEKKAKTGDGR